MGYIKSIPQELICTFGTGTGLGDLFMTICQMSMLYYGLSASQYFIFMSVMLLPYFFFFTWFE